VHAAAERRDDDELAVEALRRQVGGDIARCSCISGLSDASIAVDDARRYSRMIGLS
jgi:hypothetical protein